MQRNEQGPDQSLGALFRHQNRFRRIGVEIVEKRIFARVERPENENRGTIGREHLFLAQFIALEFSRRRARVPQFDLEALIGWHFKTLRRDLAVMELDRKNRLVFSEG